MRRHPSWSPLRKLRIITDAYRSCHPSQRIPAHEACSEGPRQAERESEARLLWVGPVRLTATRPFFGNRRGALVV